MIDLLDKSKDVEKQEHLNHEDHSKGKNKTRAELPTQVQDAGSNVQRWIKAEVEGQIQLLQVIGEGASSKVHLGKYLSNGMIVAVKLINLSSSKLVEKTSN